MSFGFSVGDFVAVGNIVSEVISSLQNAGGAAQQYQQLIVELEGLAAALVDIDKLDGPVELQPTIQTMRSSALNCRFPLQEFQASIRKYDESRLGQNDGKAQRCTNED